MRVRADTAPRHKGVDIPVWMKERIYPAEKHMSQPGKSKASAEPGKDRGVGLLENVLIQ